MGVTQALLAWIAAAAIVSQINGGGRSPSEETGGAAVPGAPVSAQNSCFASTSFSVLEVGNDPNIPTKKVTNDCWWQYPVPYLHGYVQELLGWELCNRCSVDIEFQLDDLPPDALIGCNVFIDASNSFRKTVRSGESAFVTCFGGLEVTPADHYNAGARLDGSATPFVADDPEIEIENRQGFAPAFEGRLADVKGLTSCVTTMSQGPKRLTISGEFAPTKTGATVGMVPSGPGLFSSTWGGDLVETASRTAARITAQNYQKFSVSTELPVYVTEFIVRDKAGPKEKIVVEKLAACK
jgi:hypothetical protein